MTPESGPADVPVGTHPGHNRSATVVSHCVLGTPEWWFVAQGSERKDTMMRKSREMGRTATGMLAAAALTVGMLAASVATASADPPDNKVIVEVTCEGLGTLEVRVPNDQAVFGNAATMATGQSDLVGVGVVFDLFGLFDGGRGNAPVVDGMGIAERIIPCTADLSSVGGPVGVPIGVMATGQTAGALR